MTEETLYQIASDNMDNNIDVDADNKMNVDDEDEHESALMLMGKFIKNLTEGINKFEKNRRKLMTNQKKIQET